MLMPFELNSYSEQEIFEQIILKIFKHYPEAKWLAADNVLITRESQSGNPGPGWTSHLVNIELIKAPNTDKKEISKYVELERMLTSIVFFHLFYDGSDLAYRKLVSVQKETEKLSYENFKKIHKLMRGVAKNHEAYHSVVAMLVYSDLGKAPQARVKAELQNKNFNRDYVDHDDFIEAVLNFPSLLIPQIIPSYFSLSNDARNIITKAASAMKIHLGHVLHLEGGERMFHKFKEAVDLKKVSSEVLDFAFAIQIADVAASAGQITNRGSLTFTEATCRGYLLVKATLEEIAQGKSSREALTSYLQKRGQWLNLNADNQEQAILIRLGCMLRYYQIADSKHLLDDSRSLSSENWQLLKEQFKLDRGFNTWKRNPTYLPAVLLNIVKAGGNPIEAAVCISRLFAQYEKTASNVSSGNPLCLNTLAGIATREPQLFTTEKFDIEQFTFDKENNVIKKENVVEFEFKT